jgi:hypothetical protein
MSAGRRALAYTRDFPIWRYARFPVACVESARTDARRRGYHVDGEPQVRLHADKVTLTWPQPVEAAA